MALLSVEYTLIIWLMALFLLKVHSQSDADLVWRSFDPNPTDLIYQGDAHVPSGSTVIRLTKTDPWCRPQTSSIGRVLYSTPIQLYDRSNPGKSEASITTSIFYTNTPSSSGWGDGLALFIAPVGTIPSSGVGGGNLGIYNSSSPIFAVELDTHSDLGWDPDYPHLGININSRESSIETRYIGLNDKQSYLSFVYNSTTKTIKARAFGFSGMDPMAELTYDIDLSTILPEQVQVGISTANGMFTSNLGTVEIETWYLTVNYEATAGVTEQEMMMPIHPQYDHLILQEYSTTS